MNFSAAKQDIFIKLKQNLSQLLHQKIFYILCNVTGKFSFVSKPCSHAKIGHIKPYTILYSTEIG